MENQQGAVTQYELPPKVYPRYEYSAKYSRRLGKTCQKALQKCGLNDHNKVPSFGNVCINIHSETDEDLLTEEQLVYKKVQPALRTKRTVSVKELQQAHRRSLDENVQPVVFVTSYSEAKQTDIAPHSSNLIVLISEEEVDKKLTFVKDQSNNITTYICVSNRVDFALNVCNLLERYVFRCLAERVSVLQQFLVVDEILSTPDDQKSGVNIQRKKDEYAKSLVKKYSRINSFLEATNAPATPIKHFDKMPPMRRLSTDVFIEKMNEMFVSELTEGNGLSRHEDGAVGGTQQQSMDTGNTEGPITQTAHKKLEAHLVVLSKPEMKQEIKALISEATAMYDRSNVPIDERPKMDPLPTTTKEEVPKDIFKEIEGVHGCGYRLGTFHVFLDKNVNTSISEIEQKVSAILNKHAIHEFVLRSGRKEITTFADPTADPTAVPTFKVGSEINVTAAKAGTLGGFARKGENNELCALTARHVTNGSETLKVRLNITDVLPIGDVLMPTSNVEPEYPVDISATKVYPKIVGSCETKFMDDSGNHCISRLYDFSSGRLNIMGMPVHIWGAFSRPGRGKVTMLEHCTPEKTGSGKMVTYITVENAEPDSDDDEPGQAGASALTPSAAFAKLGDSGSIVCADDASGDFLHVISILCGTKFDVNAQNGADESARYMTFDLRDGLFQLKVEHGNEEFNIC